jgi:transcriptional regulator with XRE-family HTH domain
MLFAAARDGGALSMGLGQIRKLLGVTQVELATALSLTQTNISRLESRSNITLGSLRSVIEAMGGSVDLRVRFPSLDVPIALPEHDGDWKGEPGDAGRRARGRARNVSRCHAVGVLATMSIGSDRRPPASRPARDPRGAAAADDVPVLTDLLGRRAVRVSDVGCAARESRRWGLIADLVQSAMCLACRLPDAQNLVRQQQLLGRIATHGAFQAAHPSFQADHPRLDPIHAGSHIAKLQREHARHAANRLDQRVHLSAESIDPFQR